MKIQAVVFDMDGVVFDSEPLHMKAWVESLSGVGLNYSEYFFADWVGIPDENLGKYLAEKHNAGCENIDYLQRKRNCYRQLLQKELFVFEGVAEKIRELKNVLPLGIATSSQREDTLLMLQTSGLATYFTDWSCYNDVARHKPYPDVYLLTAKKLNFEPASCVALDDSPSGVRAAKKAGMFTLGIANFFAREKLSEADKVFPTTLAACEWLLDTVRSADSGSVTRSA